jgi:hypothetical protein
MAGAPCRSRHGTSEAACAKGELIDKGLEEADGMVLGNVVVEALGEAEHVVAVRTLDMAHGGTRRREGSFFSQLEML